MKETTAIIVYTGLCSIIVILTLALVINSTVVDRQAIEKRAYEKLTKENKELIEYIVFGEKQD